MTLIELLISLSVVALLAALGLSSFVQSRSIRDLSSSGQNVLSVLRLAQSKALAGDGNAPWGVRLEPGRYVLFRGASYAGAQSTENYPLPSAIEIANITLAGGGQDVIFRRLDGKTDSAGTFDVRVSSAPLNVFAVTVDDSGKVYQTGTAPVPSGTRVVDTRHRNFILAGTIKNAATLTLRFSDPPNPDVAQPVAMSPASPRDTFDWSGTYQVGGQSQTLRVHALSIGDTSTTLSVDRDCGKNTKAVKISFDANDVVTYNADCQTMTVWPFGGTVSEP